MWAGAHREFMGNCPSWESRFPNVRFPDSCRNGAPRPSQTWRTFLDNHVRDLVSIDFFTVPTARLHVLFVFIVLSHERRRVVHFNVTGHPTAAWAAQQIVEAFPEDEAPRMPLGAFSASSRHRNTGRAASKAEAFEQAAVALTAVIKDTRTVEPSTCRVATFIRGISFRNCRANPRNVRDGNVRLLAVGTVYGAVNFD
jgi:hypothetical protein